MPDTPKIKCPEIIMRAGAFLIILRHEIKAGEATPASFSAARAAVTATEQWLFENKIPTMSTAGGMLYLIDAEKDYFHGSKARAYELERMAHRDLSEEMDYWNVTTPTDDEICYECKEIAAEYRKANRNPSKSLLALEKAANRR